MDGTFTCKPVLLVDHSEFPRSGRILETWLRCLNAVETWWENEKNTQILIAPYWAYQSARYYKAFYLFIYLFFYLFIYYFFLGGGIFSQPTLTMWRRTWPGQTHTPALEQRREWRLAIQYSSPQRHWNTQRWRKSWYPCFEKVSRNKETKKYKISFEYFMHSPTCMIFPKWL